MAALFIARPMAASMRTASGCWRIKPRPSLPFSAQQSRRSVGVFSGLSITRNIKNAWCPSSKRSMFDFSADSQDHSIRHRQLQDPFLTVGQTLKCANKHITTTRAVTEALSIGFNDAPVHRRPACAASHLSKSRRITKQYAQLASRIRGRKLLTSAACNKSVRSLFSGIRRLLHS